MAKNELTPEQEVWGRFYHTLHREVKNLCRMFETQEKSLADDILADESARDTKANENVCSPITHKDSTHFKTDKNGQILFI